MKPATWIFIFLGQLALGLAEPKQFVYVSEIENDELPPLVNVTEYRYTQYRYHPPATVNRFSTSSQDDNSGLSKPPTTFSRDNYGQETPTSNSDSGSSPGRSRTSGFPSEIGLGNVGPLGLRTTDLRDNYSPAIVGNTRSGSAFEGPGRPLSITIGRNTPPVVSKHGNYIPSSRTGNIGTSNNFSPSSSFGSSGSSSPRTAGNIGTSNNFNPSSSFGSSRSSSPRTANNFGPASSFGSSGSSSPRAAGNAGTANNFGPASSFGSSGSSSPRTANNFGPASSFGSSGSSSPRSSENSALLPENSGSSSSVPSGNSDSSLSRPSGHSSSSEGSSGSPLLNKSTFVNHVPGLSVSSFSSGNVQAFDNDPTHQGSSLPRKQSPASAITNIPSPSTDIENSFNRLQPSTNNPNKLTRCQASKEETDTRNPKNSELLKPLVGYGEQFNPGQSRPSQGVTDFNKQRYGSQGYRRPQHSQFPSGIISYPYNRQPYSNFSNQATVLTTRKRFNLPQNPGGSNIANEPDNFKTFQDFEEGQRLNNPEAQISGNLAVFADNKDFTPPNFNTASNAGNRHGSNPSPQYLNSRHRNTPLPSDNKQRGNASPNPGSNNPRFITDSQPVQGYPRPHSNLNQLKTPGSNNSPLSLKETDLSSNYPDEYPENPSQGFLDGNAPQTSTRHSSSSSFKRPPSSSQSFSSQYTPPRLTSSHHRYREVTYVKPTFGPVRISIAPLPLDVDNDQIPGKAGIDYPTYHQIPTTSFNCREAPFNGYYADIETSCQVYHLCQSGGTQDTFLCPNGTIFSQKKFACQWWYKTNCTESPHYFSLNSDLYKIPEAKLKL